MTLFPTWFPVRAAASSTALWLVTLGGLPLAAQPCPPQAVQALLPQCGPSYGATLQFTYAGAANWWFKERVVQGDPNTCQAGGIDQTTNPFQSPTGIIVDEVYNTNGPPAAVAPCGDQTHQTIYTGPMAATVEHCSFPNGQLIQVLHSPKLVRTSAAGVATQCAY